MEFYQCKNCNQVFIKLIDFGIPPHCCDNEADAIISNSFADEMQDHVPKIRKIGNFVTITVGEKAHPMVDIHYIYFILMETNQGIKYKYLRKNEYPLADFIVANDEEILNVYVYCTLHSLWSLH